MSSKKQTFLHGAALLTLATAVVKVIGALYKIPLNAIIGEKGFGYDPIFMVDEDHSMAELDQDEKNRISHRAKAFEELAKILKEKFS